MTYPISRADLSIRSSSTLCSGDLRDRDTALRPTDQTIATSSPILHKSRTLYIHVGIRLSGERPDIKRRENNKNIVVVNTYCIYYGSSDSFQALGELPQCLTKPC